MVQIYIVGISNVKIITDENAQMMKDNEDDSLVTADLLYRNYHKKIGKIEHCKSTDKSESVWGFDGGWWGLDSLSQLLTYGLSNKTRKLIRLLQGYPCFISATKASKFASELEKDLEILKQTGLVIEHENYDTDDEDPKDDGERSNIEFLYYIYKALRCASDNGIFKLVY